MRNYTLLIAVILCAIYNTLQADTYWVQVAVYDHYVEEDYFADAGLEDVVLHLDQNLIYRYYKMEYSDAETAKAAQADAQEKGFAFAKVVSADDIKFACNAPCSNPVNINKIETLYFDFDNKKLKTESREKLSRAAEILKQHPDLEIRLTGHADARGSENYNRELSEDRAWSAVDFLHDFGIPFDRMLVESKGETEPIAINQYIDGSDAPEGRRYNRRVEIQLFKKGTENISGQFADGVMHGEALLDVPSHLRLF